MRSCRSPVESVSAVRRGSGSGKRESIAALQTQAKMARPLTDDGSAARRSAGVDEYSEAHALPRREIELPRVASVSPEPALERRARAIGDQVPPVRAGIVADLELQAREDVCGREPGRHAVERHAARVIGRRDVRGLAK